MAASRNCAFWAATGAIIGLLGLGPASARAGDPGTHWPLAPAELEGILAEQGFEILSAEGGVGGVMGVKKLSLRFPASGRELKVKWKRAPDGDADGWNNTPRKEIAAYEIQKWFLDPVDYLVPTVVVRCIPLDSYAALEPKAGPNLPGTRCVMGVIVIWIENVGIDGEIYEEQRFLDDARYARYLADLNVLTYLIDHEDGRRNNFLTADDASDRRIFSIDNGVSFGAKVKNWFVPNWNKIRVPALRKESIERLRKVQSERVRALGVVAEMRVDEAGILRPAKPTPNASPKKGSRVDEGWIQLGLTRGEIEDVERRLQRLLADVDAGRVPLF